MYGDLGSPGHRLKDNIKKDYNSVACRNGLVLSGSGLVLWLILEDQ